MFGPYTAQLLPLTSSNWYLCLAHTQLNYSLKPQVTGLMFGPYTAQLLPLTPSNWYLCLAHTQLNYCL